MGSLLLAFEPVILVVHFFVATVLMLMILLQSGKGDIGAAFGAGGSQTLFGTRGAATFLSKLTTVCALVFLVTSLSLATSSKFSASGAGTTSTIEDKLKVTTETDNAVVPTDTNKASDTSNSVETTPDAKTAPSTDATGTKTTDN